MKVVVRGLTKVYTTSQGDVRAIGGVNLDVRDREFFGIIGPTGCGKTTLLHVIGRLEAPTTGTVEFVGEQPRTGEPNDDLAVMEPLFFSKYFNTTEVFHDGKHAWMRVKPTKIASWDFRKLAAL